MKYYAVTEDPNELLHYGVKGMKWGQHLFGDDLRPKSTAYRRAASKLRSFSNKTKSAVSKSFTQRAMTRQQRQQDRFNKAVEKTQRRIAITENMHNLDQLTNYERSVSNAYKADSRKNRAEAKRERRYAKNERKMDKYTQLAREGRLKYGKLSEEQIARVHDRLVLENTTRTLGGKELPKFRIRAKRALQEGLLSGITSGTAAGMTEIAKAKVQNHYLNKRALDKQSAQRAEREKQATRIKNKRTAKEIRQDLKQKAYEAEIETGQGFWDRSVGMHMSVKNAATRLQEADTLKKLNAQKAQDKLMYNRNGELTKLGKRSQEITERERLANIKTRINTERDENVERYLAETGQSLDEAVASNMKTINNMQAAAIQSGDQDKVNKLQKIIDNYTNVKPGHSSPDMDELKRSILLSAKKYTDEDKNNANKEAALKDWRKYQNRLSQIRQAEAYNKSVMDGYGKALSAWQQKSAGTGNPGPRPVMPSVQNGMLVKVPAAVKMSAKTIEELKKLNINPFSGGGGGKG